MPSQEFAQLGKTLVLLRRFLSAHKGHNGGERVLTYLRNRGRQWANRTSTELAEETFEVRSALENQKKSKAKLLDARRSFARAEPHPGFAMFVAKFAHGAIGELFNLYQPHFDRVTNQAGHVVNIKPLHQLRPVRFDSLDTDVQGETYVFGAVPFGDER